MSKLSSTSVLTAATGMKIPVIGLGTRSLVSQLNAVRGTDAPVISDEEDFERGLNAALEVGYRMIDTAFLYNNEEAIGRVLKQWFLSGRLKREDVFITTKLPPHANNPKYVREYMEKQLKALQLDYVDLYLIHSAVGLKNPKDIPGMTPSEDGRLDPGAIQLDMTTDHVAVWKEMEKLVDDKMTKFIGLSNYNVRQIERVMKNGRIPPSNLEIELYLYLQNKEVLAFCKKNGITVTSFATMGSPSAPQGANFNPQKEPVVERIAKAHGKSPSQVLLRHALQLGVAIIPKSTNRDRLKQNIDIFDFELSKAEMLQLNVLDRCEEGRRFFVPMMSVHPEYPFKKPTA